MRNNGCDHVGHRKYARRVFKNGTVHYCVQCTKCLKVLKLPEHGMRPWLKPDEIPAWATLSPFIAGDANE